MYVSSFFRVWLVTQMLMLAYGDGTPNAYFCKQGYLVGQKSAYVVYERPLSAPFKSHLQTNNIENIL